MNPIMMIYQGDRLVAKREMVKKSQSELGIEPFNGDSFSASLEGLPVGEYEYEVVPDDAGKRRQISIVGEGDDTRVRLPGDR
jgi:hypothetical protein